MDALPLTSRARLLTLLQTTVASGYVRIYTICSAVHQRQRSSILLYAIWMGLFPTRMKVCVCSVPTAAVYHVRVVYAHHARNRWWCHLIDDGMRRTCLISAGTRGIKYENSNFLQYWTFQIYGPIVLIVVSDRGRYRHRLFMRGRFASKFQSPITNHWWGVVVFCALLPNDC